MPTAAAVHFDGIRVDPSDTITNWGNWTSAGPAGGGAPAAEAQLAYQGGLAVNTKVTVTGTSRDGLDYDPGAGAVDMNFSNRRLWFCKVIVGDSFDIQTGFGIEMWIGSSSANYYAYCLSGTDSNNPAYTNYPKQGGYIITAIDPNISGWTETALNGGTIDQSAIDYWAGGCALINGAAKAENWAIDAIDIGRGLWIQGGDNGTPGTFLDFVAEDQDITSNRWGVVTGSGASVKCNGMLQIGNASSTGTNTTFSDTTSVLTFSDGYHSANTSGVTVYAYQSNDNKTIGALMLSEGRDVTEETRANFKVFGSNGTISLSSTMTNFYEVILQSQVVGDGMDIEAKTLTQNSAELKNGFLRADSAANTAMISGPLFGSASGIHDVTCTQSGNGHMFEITSAGSYTLTNINFSGFPTGNTGTLTGKLGPSNAAIKNSAGTGTVTISIVGGTIPSIYNVTGANTVVESSVNVTLTSMKDASEVRVYTNGTTTQVAGVEDVGSTDNPLGSGIDTGSVGGTTDDRSYTFSAAPSDVVDIKVFNIDWISDNFTLTVPAGGAEIPIAQRFDRVYNNP